MILCIIYINNYQRSKTFSRVQMIPVNVDRKCRTIIKSILISPVRITFGEDRIDVIVLLNLIIEG